MCSACFIVLFKQKTAYELRISDWSSDVCSSDLLGCPTTAGCTTMLSSVVADSKSGLLILPSPQPANIRAANAPKKPTALTALIGSSCPCSLTTNIRFPTRCRIYGVFFHNHNRESYMNKKRTEAHTSELQSPMSNSYA